MEEKKYLDRGQNIIEQYDYYIFMSLRNIFKALNVVKKVSIFLLGQ